ncbi:MAG: 5,6-dimethylbenzimidazole synthase [Pseudomonadales bacterium]|nr:5,6-dimethylbenzimidazole synthase [Pseudomonadales bacterium]MCP5303536.1 5,6-dimethylbenzimidazole synthase [Pseudomonadales bacterium]
MNKIFSDQEREAFYEVLYSRRDVRRHFLNKVIPDDVLARILNAAHHAPSVGLSQPWNFILVKQPHIRQRVFEAFTLANEEARQMFEGDRREQYSSLKLEGILETPLNILVTCDRTRGGNVVLGKTHQPEMDMYSTVCAVQNLWLAARAENVGVGWVSIVQPQALADIFNLPDHVKPIAYLCVGYVEKFADKPELATCGWEKQLSLDEMVFEDGWPGS